MEKDANSPRLGDVLVATGLLAPAQVEEALKLQVLRGCRLGEVIVQEGILTQDQINWALARHFGLSYVDVQLGTLDRELARSLRPGLLYQHCVIPLVRMGRSVTLAMGDPTDLDAVREVRDTLHCEVTRAIANAEPIRAALQAIFTSEELRLSMREDSGTSEFSKMASRPAPRQRLGEILLDALLISEDQLAAVLAKQRAEGKRLGEVLIDDGICTEDQINWALSRHLNVPYIDLGPESIDPALGELVPLEFLREHICVPMMKLEHELVLAMADPLDDEALARVAGAAQCAAVVAIARRGDIRKAIRHVGEALAASRPLADEGVPEGAEGAEEAGRNALSPQAIQAFKETVQHNPLTVSDKIKAYYAVHKIVKARQRGGAAPARAARQETFQGLSSEGIKLALQLVNQVGKCDVPILMDEEFTAKYGRAGVLHDNDRRFIVDRRVYDRTIQAHAQQFSLEPVQIDNAVMAARAYVLSGGKQQILLISEGEKKLAEALTRIIRLAETREMPAAPSPQPAKPEHRAPNNDPVHKALQATIAESGLSRESCSKIVRAFRFILKSPGAESHRGKLKQIIDRGALAGFSPDELKLLERMLRIKGYNLG